MKKTNLLFSNYNYHEDWAYKFIEKYFNVTDKVLVIPFSFGENIVNKTMWDELYTYDGEYYQGIVEPLLSFGIQEKNISWLNYFEDDYQSAVNKIQSSEIIFFTGGLPDKMMLRIKEFKIANLIENFNGVIIGASAGAMIQLKNYHISPDEDYRDFSYQEGLNLLTDFAIEVHYKRTEVEDFYINKVLKEKTDTVYAITDFGGIIVEDNDITLIGDVCIFCG